MPIKLVSSYTRHGEAERDESVSRRRVAVTAATPSVHLIEVLRSNSPVLSVEPTRLRPATPDPSSAGIAPSRRKAEASSRAANAAEAASSGSQRSLLDEGPRLTKEHRLDRKHEPDC